tara:strand:+ start:295 stop:621 length:327 start_codon:yes stop_codon:yes gene_type:complete
MEPDITAAIQRVVATQSQVNILLNSNRSTMLIMAQVSRALGTTPDLEAMNTTTLASWAHLPLNEAGTMTLMGLVSASAEREWPEAFAAAFSEAMVLEQDADNNNSPTF